MFHHALSIETSHPLEILDITSQVQSAVHAAEVSNGLVLVSTPHTTAALRLNHAEPLLLQDTLRELYRLVPHDTSYNHDQHELRQGTHPKLHTKGHAHLKALLLGQSATLPLVGGRLVLGDQQNILFVECAGPKKRTVHVTVIADA
ncbi:MAG: secondary thiamine-phosphate synthase enzyme YjbQ [Candidatus Doudnabacteria bacterium]|nr:secondary thiamine-phosphate synthase enzyme YjbQ [Candidatus Doudnabacteria bacterium]